MITATVRRYLGLAVLAVAAVVGLRGDYYTGDTYINLDARGQSAYNISVYATIVPGGQIEASAWASYGPISGSSWGWYGEAGVVLHFWNIRKVNGTWKAETVTKQILKPDASGWDYYNYSEVVIPNTSWAQGYATCSQYSNQVNVQVD